MPPRFITSQGCQWSNPRPVICEARRRHIYGAIQPMEEPRVSIWRRLWRTK